MAEINSLLRNREIPFVVFLNQENNNLAGLLDHEAQLEDFLLVHLLPWQDPRWMGSDIKNFTNSVADGHPNKCTKMKNHKKPAFPLCTQSHDYRQRDNDRDFIGHVVQAREAR